MATRRFSTYYLEAFYEAKDDPPVIREARALYAKLSQVDIGIAPGDRIVGECYYEPFDFSTGPGCYLDRDHMDPCSDATRLFNRKVDELLPIVGLGNLFSDLTEQEWDVQKAHLARSIGFGGHMTFDYRKLLKTGIPGLASSINRCRDKYKNDQDKQQFFDAMQTTLEAVRVFIRRHGDLALELSAGACSPEKTRLAGIAEDCLHIADKAPETFTQALQLLWFYHVLDEYDSFGRFDYALQDFYIEDIISGRMTRVEASVLLEEIWHKIDPNSIQNMTIGGQTSQETESSTDFTLLCIEVMEKCALPQPNLCLRVSRDTPKEILEAAVSCIASGTGNPAIYNDEVIVPALIELGIPSEDAFDYSLAGCSQVVIPGRCNFACDDGLFNAAKCLELALNDGIDPASGKRLGPSTGKADTFTSFIDVQKAFESQVKSAAGKHTSILDKTDVKRSKMWTYVHRTLLTEDCLENAEGIWKGGARYNAIQTECLGITNAADSLTAIKTLVFDRRLFSLSQVMSFLESNWDGYESERMAFLNKAPKFGNDDPDADGMAAWTSKAVWTELRRQRISRGNGHLIPGGVIFLFHIDLGEMTGATPDGRKSGDPLADSSGPAQGRDRSGPTAMLKSAAKLPLHLAATCAVVNLKLSRQAVTDPAVRERMLDMFRSYLIIGGMQLQVTVADKISLLDAQVHPENYGNLIVRVGGYSARFTSISKELQDDIISRTEN